MGLDNVLMASDVNLRARDIVSAVQISSQAPVTDYHPDSINDVETRSPRHSRNPYACRVARLLRLCCTLY
jgi:hypothetical protein